MHTDRFDRGLAVLALAAMIATAHALPAQDTLVAGSRATPATEPRHVPDRVVVGSDVVIPRDEIVDGKVIVTGGDLRVMGRVMGNVTVVGGDLTLEPGAAVGGSVQVSGGDFENAGRVQGDARVVGGRLVSDDGRVYGEMRVEGGEERGSGRSLAGDNRMRMGRHGFLGQFSAGLSGLLSTVALGLLLAGLGAASVFYARARLDRVSDSVRADTLRGGALGLATSFLLAPAYIVGIVILVFTVIGIPLLLVFIPLFPVLALTAAACGVVAVSHALGERTAERRASWEAQYRNSYAYVFTGVALLLAPLVAANLLKMTGFLSPLGGLVEFLGWLGLAAASAVGFGAILLTRAGSSGPWQWRRRHEYDPVFDGPAGGAGV